MFIFRLDGSIDQLAYEAAVPLARFGPAAPTIIQSAATFHRVGAFLFHAALRERKQAD